MTCILIMYLFDMLIHKLGQSYDVSSIFEMQIINVFDLVQSLMT
jgi:hypothetical protein